MPHLSMSLLGPFVATLDGRPLTRFRTRGVQALLIYLVCQPEAHRRESLMALLWPEISQQSAQNSLRQALYHLRKAIPETAARDSDESVTFLYADRHIVQVNPDALYHLDVLHFTSLLEGDSENWPGAVDLYRGDFLDDFYLPDSAPFEEWVLARRADLRRQALAALDELTTRWILADNLEIAEGYARQQLQIDNLRESAHRQLMEILARRGQRAEAVNQYEICRQLLEEELGIETAAETQALVDAIRAGRFEPGAETLAFEVVGVQTRIATAQPPAFLCEETAAREVVRPVFVARRRQLERLNLTLEKTLAGQGQVMFITGGAGRGKTALMQEFAARAMERHADLLVAHGNCSVNFGRGDPYLPFREIMEMLTGDVESLWAAGSVTADHARRLWANMLPAIQTILEHGPYLLNTLIAGRPLLSRAATAAFPYPDWFEELRRVANRDRSGSANMDQSQLLEQLTNILRAVAGSRPLLLILDDLQWADAASISLLFYLGRQLAGCRALILCAYRPEEVALGQDGHRHPLEKVVAEFTRSYGDCCIDLAQLEEGEDARFVNALLETEPNQLGQQFRSSLNAHTQGHPLFTVELLRAMQGRGDLVRDEAGNWVTSPELNWDAFPTRVEAVIEERLSRLDEALRESLSVASVEGEVFTAQVLARVQQVGERQLLQALSRELRKRHRLVREQGEVTAGRQHLSRYRFAHALFRQHLYNELGAGERRFLHAAVAQSLEAMYGEHAEEISVQLAHHYDAAGDEVQALKYHTIAADAAQAAYAHQEAEAHYRQGLELASSPPERAHLLAGLGRTLFSSGDYEEAERCWSASIGLFKAMRSSGLEGLANVYGNWLRDLLASTPKDKHLGICQEAVAATLNAPDSHEQARLLVVAGYRLGLLGPDHYDVARSLNSQALAMAERLGAVAIQAEALAMSYMLPGNAAETERKLKRGLQLAESVGQLDTLAISHHCLGMFTAIGGHLRIASEHYRQNYNLNRRMGFRHGVTTGLANTIVTLTQLGEFDEAEAIVSKHEKQLEMTPAPLLLLKPRGHWEKAARLWRAERERWAHDRFQLTFRTSGLAGVLAEWDTLTSSEHGIDRAELETLLWEVIEYFLPHWIRQQEAAWAFGELVKLHARQERYDYAGKLLIRAKQLLRTEASPRIEAHLLTAEGWLAAAEGHCPEAIGSFEAAHNLFVEMEMRWDQARIRIDWAEAVAGRGEPGDLERARKLLAESLSLFQEMGCPGYEDVVEERLQALS